MTPSLDWLAHMDSARSFPAERRQELTIMFCDLAGSTSRCQGLDPEESRDFQRRFRQTCADVVKQPRYHGCVAQEAGDGVMIYFGWPTAHEDDAERCVRAALEILESVTSLSAVEPVDVHIGIATGPVVVGGIPGPGGSVELAVGPPVPLAERLHKYDKNKVLIAHETRTLLGSTFELTDLGMLSLKDIGPSRAWRVDAVRRAVRFDAAHGDVPLNALVGRTDEVALMQREWQVAWAGAGRAVLVGGEAGIGKSRLTQVLRERIVGEPHITMRYQCSPFHQDVALYPVITQIELAAGFARDDTPDQKLDKLERILVGSPAQRDECAPLIAAMLSLPTDRYSPLGLSAQQQRERTLAQLFRQIEIFAQTQPVLMIVEDAHWIDPTSQELLNETIARLPALRVMLVVTYRTDQARPYASTWADLPYVSSVTLAGLPQAESAELVINVAKGKALPADVLEQIVVRADGLPLHIEELTKSVLESPQLLEEADRYLLVAPMPTLPVPRTLKGLLFDRMDRREGMSTLAQIGAFIGRTFSYELLAAIAANEVRNFDEVLEELTRTELVYRRGTPPHATYTFKHALVQDAAYESMPKKTARDLHGRIADLLERDFPEVTANEPQLLAHHRSKAGQLTAAIPFWRRAGEAALARVALQEAVNHLERGLTDIEKLPPSPDRDTLELSLREPLHSARLRWRGWACSEVGANAMAILSLNPRHRQPQTLVVGLWGMWINTITQGRVAESMHWARRLLVEGNHSGNVDMQIYGHRALLSSHFYSGELQEALEQRERIQALYDPKHATRWMELTGNDTKTAVGVFGSQALWMLGYPDQAADLTDQKNAHSRQLGNPFDIGWALTWGAYVFDYRGEPDRLLNCVREADRLGREQSIPVYYKVLVPMVEGLALLRKGELSDAIASLRAGIDGWRGRAGNLNLPYSKCALAEALARQGDLESSLRVLDECLDQIDRAGWHERVWLAETLRLRGWVLMLQGKRAEAEGQLRASIDWARRQRARSWELRSATMLAMLLIEGKRRDAARELLAPLYHWFSEGFETHDLKAARSLLDELR